MTTKTRDRRSTNWFWCDNQVIDNLGRQLGPIAVATYCALARHANTDGHAWPAKSTIASEIHASPRAVQTALHQLQDAGAISIYQEPQHASNTYTLLDPPWNPKPEDIPAMPAKAFWDKCLAQLQHQMTKSTFTTWLEHTTAELEEPGATLTIYATSLYGTDWLDLRLRKIIQPTVNSIAGHEIAIQFRAPKPQEQVP